MPKISTFRIEFLLMPYGVLPVIFFFILACGSSNSIRKSSILPMKIINTTLAKEIKDAVYYSMPLHPTKQFCPQDKQVISHVEYINLSGTHHLRWDWYTPGNRLYQTTGNYAVKASEGKYVKQGNVFHSIDLKGAKAVEYPGNWRVEIYLDDALAAIDDFTVQANSAAQTQEISGINFGKYHALVIGINNYEKIKKLKSATNDARELAKTLSEKYDFTVTLLLDATRAEIILALDKIRTKLTEDDNLLIYFAGHGVLDDAADEGFWLAVDASEDNTLNWISNHQITATLKAMLARHVLVVADSCYAGKLVRDVPAVSSRGIGLSPDKPKDYYASIVDKKARTLLCSGGLEPVEDSDGKSGHSVFAAALIEILATNEEILDGTQLFSRLRRPVMLNADQTPEYSDIRKAGHDGGDFLFIPNHLLPKEK